MKEHRGGRRSGGGAGGNPVDIESEMDMMSARKRTDITREAAEEVYSVAMDIEKQYAYALEGTLVVSKLKGRAKKGVLGYYSHDGTIGVNETYFNSEVMKSAYAQCVQAGFHPSNGNKTAMQAVVAHEYGHALTGAAMKKLNTTDFKDAAERIVTEARKLTSHRGNILFGAAISGYAKSSNSETIAEAFSDYYCNGNNAKAESKAVMQVLYKYL